MVERLKQMNYAETTIAASLVLTGLSLATLALATELPTHIPLQQINHFLRELSYNFPMLHSPLFATWSLYQTRGIWREGYHSKKGQQYTKKAVIGLAYTATTAALAGINFIASH